VNQRIEFVCRDHSGITTVITSNGVIDAETAIEHIRSGRARFIAGPTTWDHAEVSARDAFGGSYLFANWDGTRKNNLHELASPMPAPPADTSAVRQVRGSISASRLIAVATATVTRRMKRTDL
jgi:hypothetical protein